MALAIEKPGLYEMDEESYHRDPCPAPALSSSLAKLLLQKSPRHAWTASPRLNPKWKSKDRGIFDLGKTAHALMLGDPRRFVVIEAEDWRTKAAKEARDAAYAEGKTPLLAAQWERVQEMVAAGRQQIEAHEDGSDAFTNGKPEMTLIWQEGSVWCRARLDWLPNAGRIYRDYKSTGESAHPDAWARNLYTLGYDVQAALYRRGIRKVLGERDPIFEFVVQETEEPFALSVIGMPPEAVDVAERKVDEAIRWWGWCLENDCWPGYPNRTAYVEPPIWIQNQWLEREARDGLVREAGDEALFRAALDWQRPLTKEAQ